MNPMTFEIGDQVFTKVGAESIHRCVGAHLREIPCSSRVVGRVTDECSGGIQRFYKIEGWDGRIATVSEFSVVPAAEVFEQWTVLLQAETKKGKETP